ncbi:phosphotransferase enzyme family protein [Paracoccidioides lutzii Pb01]|uniref:Phosphotransferase enzyme family protein n=1 Tax=Paracoccidioides lutzii (strain ATCC MYA-826 / Pb01) TaxID=502779 RepID=C1GX05_PARBA|nr:phosphotransferase enzyme family protein [Paracoccidioides lutzii Pb01]EEH41093.2 phosphotransferase enzyme family protein [Paracoccidioides lutzii Pb01]
MSFANDLSGPADSNIRQTLFSYTSGRFMYNETKRLAERYVEFNVAALKEAVCKHTGRARVTSLAKLAEGRFNRVFLLALDDGLQVIVKIPFHNSFPKQYATASEVATLAFLRTKGVPVPKVYGWSSVADNEVGTEYIIMDYVSGVGLDTKWYNLTRQEQTTVAIQIVEVERILFNIPFGSYGSIYFKKNIPPKLQSNLYVHGVKDPLGDSDIFCIGPSVDYRFWYGKRAEMQVDRGPWRNPHEYLAAIGKRELEWTYRYGKPLEGDFPFNKIQPGMVYPGAYCALLEKYISMSPFLLPRDTRHPGNSPTLRHPDLTPSDVFISPETFKISGIIDWQHAVIIPRLLASGHPRLFKSPDGTPPPTPGAPQPPDGYESLDPEAKAQVDELLRRRYLYYFYDVFNRAKNHIHMISCANSLLEPRKQLVDYAGRQWNGSLISLRGALIQMCEWWALLQERSWETCPITFTAAEVKEQEAHEPIFFDFTGLVNCWREGIGGMSDNGWVRTEVYEQAAMQNRELKERLLENADPVEFDKIKRGWPFQDKEEFF